MLKSTETVLVLRSTANKRRLKHIITNYAYSVVLYDHHPLLDKLRISREISLFSNSLFELRQYYQTYCHPRYECVLKDYSDKVYSTFVENEQMNVNHKPKSEQTNHQIKQMDDLLRGVYIDPISPDTTFRIVDIDLPRDIMHIREHTNLKAPNSDLKVFVRWTLTIDEFIRTYQYVGRNENE